MITVQDLKNGVTFQMDGQPFIVLKYEHIKLGRGTATIRVKVKNLITGTTLEKTFINSARVEEITTLRRKIQYLYKDGKNYIFMDPKTYEQVAITGDVLDSSANFLKAGEDLNILFWDERALWVELPPKMEFTVAETPPGVKGNSATNMYKPATLENGLELKVPLFVNKGDKIRVDTRTGEYVDRAK
jgi:elongation factor P